MARGDTFNISTELVVETCCECRMQFAMTREFERELRKQPGPRGLSFYCPAGHCQHYVGESEETKLRRERDRLKQENARLEDLANEANATARAEADRADHERRRANGYKGFAAKITSRAQNGICPCCNRSFSQLARHMKTKHPDFTPLKVVDA